MASHKVTISIDPSELAWIEKRAKRLNHGNLSAAFVDGLHALRRREALEDFLRLSKAPRLTSDEVAAVIDEVRGSVPKPKQLRRKSRARSAA